MFDLLRGDPPLPRWKRKKRKRQRQLLAKGVGFFFCVVIGIVCIVKIVQMNRPTMVSVEEPGEIEKVKYVEEQPNFTVDLLTPNEYSRPQTAIEKVTGIVVHYTANPGTTAKQNRDYFESLATTHQTSASSHFVIGLEGEIIQCIPCNEMSYASNHRNSDTISIECCIADKSGKFNAKTYDALVELVSWLMGRYNLTSEDVIRHYDVTGKACPKYFVDHEDAWKQFHKDLDLYVSKHGINK